MGPGESSLFEGNGSIDLEASNGVPKFDIGIYMKNYIFGFFDETTWPIATKLKRNHHWGMGIQVLFKWGP